VELVLANLIVDGLGESREIVSLLFRTLALMCLLWIPVIVIYWGVVAGFRKWGGWDDSLVTTTATRAVFLAIGVVLGAGVFVVNFDNLTVEAAVLSFMLTVVAGLVTGLVMTNTATT
jgi:hypothetical protein